MPTLNGIALTNDSLPQTGEPPTTQDAVTDVLGLGDLLWVPYVGFSVLVVIFFLISFIRYHLRRKKRAARRAHFRSLVMNVKELNLVKKQRPTIGRFYTRSKDPLPLLRFGDLVVQDLRPASVRRKAGLINPIYESTTDEDASASAQNGRGGGKTRDGKKPSRRKTLSAIFPTKSPPVLAKQLSSSAVNLLPRKKASSSDSDGGREEGERTPNSNHNNNSLSRESSTKRGCNGTSHFVAQPIVMENLRNAAKTETH